jgi:hypothetical protein
VGCKTKWWTSTILWDIKPSGGEAQFVFGFLFGGGPV